MSRLKKPIIPATSIPGFEYTRHARKRCQQRCLQTIADIVCQYGHCHQQPGGTKICHMDRRALDEVRAEIGDEQYRKLASKLRRAYVVLSSENTVITVGYRYKKSLH